MFPSIPYSATYVQLEATVGLATYFYSIEDLDNPGVSKSPKLAESIAGQREARFVCGNVEGEDTAF
jgi:hypothetical protein